MQHFQHHGTGLDKTVHHNTKPLHPASPNFFFLDSLQDDVFATVTEWLADVTCNRNPIVVLVAALLYTHEENYVEALKVCRSSLSLEM